jgi:hypothetical protein
MLAGEALEEVELVEMKDREKQGKYKFQGGSCVLAASKLVYISTLNLRKVYVGLERKLR